MYAFVAWRTKALNHHMVETQADTYAEYIAIIYSAAIAGFWTGNPQYIVRLQGSETSSVWISLAWQAGLEVFVDYVSSVIEIKVGIVPETQDRRFSIFLTFLSIMLTVTNIVISATLYIRAR